jgi:hypothetical protein
VDAYALEGVVEEMYGRADAAPGDVWMPTRLARRLGVRVVRIRGAVDRGRLSRVNGEPVIGVRAGLPTAIEEWTVGHELGHLFGVVDEAACDYVGAAIPMRRRPFLRALHDLGDAWHLLGERFGATSTSAALRAAELEERALAVVTPKRVYPRLIHLPDEAIRRLARHGAPGIVRAKLVDEPRRTVVEAREVEGETG